MKRFLSNTIHGIAFAFFLTTCVFWYRGKQGVDEVALTYDRYLADGSAANNRLDLTSDHRLWLGFSWGQVGPYNGQLVWGYHLNADKSGGRPQIYANSYPYEPILGIESLDYKTVMSNREKHGWGPVRWSSFQRTDNGEQYRSIQVGCSHWLVAMFFVGIPLRSSLSRSVHTWTTWIRRARLGKPFGSLSVLQMAYPTST